MKIRLAGKITLDFDTYIEVDKESDVIGQVLEMFTRRTLDFKDQVLSTGRSLLPITVNGQDVVWLTVESDEDEEFETVEEFKGRVKNKKIPS